MPNTLTVQTWDLVLPRPSQVLVTNPDRAVAVSFLENCFTDTQQSETLCFSSYLLSFAAGAMLYVVVEELIPEMSQGQHSNVGTVFFAVGFSVMMVLDVALG